MKTEKQKIAQSILLLKILHVDNNIYGKTKLQKQVFLNELKLVESNLGGLYYKYFRYNYGPFSSDLWTDITVLSNRGFIHKTTFALTERGQHLLDLAEAYIGDYKDNEVVFDLVKKTTEKYRRYNGLQLKKMVYDMEIEPEDMPGQILRVEEMPVFTDILLPECRDFEYDLQIPEDSLNDLKTEIEMDKHTWDHIEEIHAGKIKIATRRLKNAVAAG